MVDRTYPEFSTRYPLLLKTIMKRPANIYPHEIGVVHRNADSGEYFRFTWQEWYKRISKMAYALKDLAVATGKADKPGDRIATMSLNHHRHLELYYAVPCFGAVLHPINIRLSPDHIVHTINHAKDRIIFFDDTFLPLLESIYERIKSTVEKFVYISDRPGLPDTKIDPVYEYEKIIKEKSSEFPWPDLDENTYATLCYSTGTTGLPKGAMFTHRQIYLQALHLIATKSWNADPELTTSEADSIPMINVPLFHIHAWGSPFYNVFGANKIVLPGRFTPQGFCELVQTEKVTISGLVPTMLVMLLEYEDLKKYDLSSLNRIGVGGSALSLGLKTKAEKMIPGFSTTNGYGLTETAAIAVGTTIKKTLKDLPKEKLDEFKVKTGLPHPGIEVDVVDEKGNPVPRDNETIGEIVIRGSWIMEKYYNDPEKTAEVWKNGWFHTGDVAIVDEESYITIVDRITDVIRSGSEMIPTVLLENITTTADFVLEAAYVGIPDEKWGERPMALIKLMPEIEKTVEDVHQYLQTEGVAKGKITRWMLPNYIVFVDEIPKTSVGKIDKIAIKKRTEKYLSNALSFSTISMSFY